MHIRIQCASMREHNQLAKGQRASSSTHHIIIAQRAAFGTQVRPVQTEARTTYLFTPQIACASKTYLYVLMGLHLHGPVPNRTRQKDSFRCCYFHVIRKISVETERTHVTLTSSYYAICILQHISTTCRHVSLSLCIVERRSSRCTTVQQPKTPPKA